MLYNNTAFPHPVTRQSTGSLPQYLFGNFDFHTIPFIFAISKTAITSGVATLTVQLVSGGGGATAGSNLTLPAVGAVMGVQGTTKSAGVYNVDPTTVSAVSINTATGAGTISYSLSHADIAQATDTGTVAVWPYEYPDLVASGSASAPIAQSFTPDDSDNARCIFCDAVWTGTVPTTATVVLQVANVDKDSRYITVNNAAGSPLLASVTSSQVIAQAGAEYTFIMGKFIRAKVTAMTGGDSTTGLIVTMFS